MFPVEPEAFERSSASTGSAIASKTPLSFMNLFHNIGKTLTPVYLGFRANWAPGLVLQFFVISIVAGYFNLTTVQALFDDVGAVKKEWGVIYAALATAFFGGVVPFLVLRLSGRGDMNHPGREFGFYALFWLWKGIEVDALYRLQGMMFGEGAGAAVIVPKVLVDQFVYNPLWGAPSQVLCFLWKDSGFSATEVRRRLQYRPFRGRVIEVLASTWLVWIPAVTFIYTLPPPLQIPLFNLVLCFWTLLVTFVAKEGDSRLCNAE